MLTRLYANNYRTLVAFDIKFDHMEVFCGANGTGKSSMFDAIKFVRDLATGRCLLGRSEAENMNMISRLDFTNWMQSNTQEFEIELTSDGRRFAYIIHLEQTSPNEQPRIVKEIATCNDKTLYKRDLDGVKFGSGTGFPLDWRQAALPSIQSANNDWRDILSLQEAFAKLVILQPNVRAFEQESKIESRFPNHDFSNLTSWYRHLAQDQDWTDVFRESLQEVWPNDFKSLKLNDAGISSKWLGLRFQGTELRFDQLSDGEKMLVALYMLHAALYTKSVQTVLIDEPDSHVGLQELQPWLLSMSDIIDENRQTLIISHSLELITSNPSHGVFFWRDNHNSPTRAGRMTIPEGLSIGEALARGWATGVVSDEVCENA